MGEPHAFAELIGPRPEPEPEIERPKIVRPTRPPAHLTCPGGYTIVNGKWARSGPCGVEVESWPAKGDVPPAAEVRRSQDAPQDEIAEWGASPSQSVRLLPRRVYAGLCVRCGQAERAARDYLRKRSEQGDDEEPRVRGYRR